jgi:Zn-dependent protease
MFITFLWENPFFYLSWVGVLAFSICVHEYAHAHTALRLGDSTAAEQGHLSLNPVVQMGGSAMLCLVLFGIGWGAVPVSPERYRETRDWALVAFAGPAANLILCAVMGLLMLIAGALPLDAKLADLITRFFNIGCIVNATFFVFNLLPVPIFDGWSVFSFFFPKMRDVDPVQAQGWAWMVLVLVFVSPLGNLIWAAGRGLAEFVVGLERGLLGPFLA